MPPLHHLRRANLPRFRKVGVAVPDHTSDLHSVHKRCDLILTCIRISFIQPAGTPFIPPQDLASRPRRNRRSSNVREAFGF